MLDSLFSRITKLAGTLQVQNALTPALWLCAVVTLGSIGGIVATEGVIRYLLFGLAVLPVLFAMYSYEQLRRENPKFLQSEQYQLRRYMLENFSDEYEATSDRETGKMSDKQQGLRRLLDEDGRDDTN